MSDGEDGQHSTPVPDQGRPPAGDCLAERPGGRCVLPEAMACAAHLAAGGTVALLEPFGVTRPHTRGFQIEYRLVAMVQGR